MKLSKFMGTILLSGGLFLSGNRLMQIPEEIAAAKSINYTAAASEVESQNFAEQHPETTPKIVGKPAATGAVLVANKIEKNIFRDALWATTGALVAGTGLGLLIGNLRKKKSPEEPSEMT